MIKPRVVFGGHTHHGCHLKYANGIEEFTVSSFNWRNKYNPSYMLVSYKKKLSKLIFCLLVTTNENC